MQGIHQQPTLLFESMRHVSRVVRVWILGTDDWLRGQSKLCPAAWWREGGEAERKWTWWADQNTVRQGNKVKWSQDAIPLENESMMVLFIGNPPGYPVWWIYSTIESIVNMFSFCSKHVRHVFESCSDHLQIKHFDVLEDLESWSIQEAK